MMPPNGASRLFWFITAVSLTTWAWALRCVAWASSRSLIAVTPRFRSSIARSSWVWLSSREACAAARSARSMLSSSWARCWPSSMWSFALKSTSRTIPAVSTASSTPWAARAVPIALRPGFQVTGSTSIVDTVTGGGCIEAK